MLTCGNFQKTLNWLIELLYSKPNLIVICGPFFMVKKLEQPTGHLEVTDWWMYWQAVT